MKKTVVPEEMLSAAHQVKTIAYVEPLDAPEPEVPESIKDLRKMMADYFNHSSGPSYPDDLLVEAYRRGLAYAKRPAP